MEVSNWAVILTLQKVQLCCKSIMRNCKAGLSEISHLEMPYFRWRFQTGVMVATLQHLQHDSTVLHKSNLSFSFCFFPGILLTLHRCKKIRQGCSKSVWNSKYILRGNYTINFIFLFANLTCIINLLGVTGFVGIS